MKSPLAVESAIRSGSRFIYSSFLVYILSVIPALQTTYCAKHVHATQANRGEELCAAMWRLPIQPDEVPLSRTYHQREHNGADEPGYIMVVDDSPEIGAALTK